MNWLRYALLPACLAAALTGHAQSETLLAFGSCSHQNNEIQMWDDIIAQQPALFIWGGDNVYGDTHDMEVLRKKYAQQKQRESYQRLLKQCPVTGTWDDHDYGINDGGRFYAKREESKRELAEFLGLGPTHDIWKHEGVYHSYEHGTGKRKIRIVNLDTRYFRDTLVKVYYFDSVSQSRKYRYAENPEGDILGEAQWRWLERELNRTDAAITIINSSIQVLSEEHRFEKWSNFPNARTRLLNLIARAKAPRILIISGDRHIAEASALRVPGLPYPLYDITSSGLTHTWSSEDPEANRHRVGSLIVQKNFGLLRIGWKGDRPAVTVEIRGANDQLFASHIIRFSLN